jgi:hypothetical protein
MPVVGKNLFIISETGKVADVKSFSLDYEPANSDCGCSSAV